MPGVFQNIDPPPPRPASVYPPARTHSLGGEWGGGSIFLKTPDTALYSTNVSTLWVRASAWGQTFNFLIFKYSVSIRLLHTFLKGL
jgi:hypothetical protein